MDIQLKQKVIEVHSLVTDTRTETQNVLRNVELMKSDLVIAKDAIKVLQRENIERDSKIEEMRQENKYLQGKIDVLQDQIAKIWSSIPRLSPLPLKTSLEDYASENNAKEIHDASSEVSQPVQKFEQRHDDIIKLKETGQSLRRHSPTLQTSGCTSVNEYHQVPEQKSDAKKNFTTAFSKAAKDLLKGQPVHSFSTADTGTRGSAVVLKTEEGTVETTREILAEQSKEYYMSESVWIVEAEAEVNSASKTFIGKIHGALTVLLVDASASMKENGAWTQASAFVNDYLTGLHDVSTRHDVNNEYVAIVTFGAQTRCQQRFTTDYALLKKVFASLKVGGPSPLHGGLHMSTAAIFSPDIQVFTLANEVKVYPKIILITDGYPTELRLHSGPDRPDPKQMGETTAALLTSADNIRKRSLEIFCVPVGKSNMEFLNRLLSKECGRRILQMNDGFYFSRRVLLSSKLRQRFDFLQGRSFYIPEDDKDISGRDIAHMQDILENIRAMAFLERQKQDNNPFNERSRFDQFIPLGSRVRRGPDWVEGDEDGNGPGTVVGHHLIHDRVFVQWDNNDDLQIYDYGYLNRYSVLPVDEPRIPLPGQPLDVGCIVKPGKDWKGDRSVSIDMKGVILQICENRQGIGKAVVRWENGKRDSYSYGADRVFEIELCFPETQATSVTKYVTEVEDKELTQAAALETPNPDRQVARTGATTRTSKNSFETQRQIQQKTSKNKNKNRDQ